MDVTVKQYLGDGIRIPCMAHLLNLIVDGATRGDAPVLRIANQQHILNNLSTQWTRYEQSKREQRKRVKC